MARSRSRRNVQTRNVNRVRNGIIGGVAVLVAAVLVYGIVYSTGATDSGEMVAGEHYRLIENPLRRRPGEPIVVTEFFSYGCIHCWNFEPLVKAWRGDQPDDVRFERSPVSFNPVWANLAQTYVALEEIGALDAHHARIFRAIHENGRQFLTRDQIADFVARRGTNRQGFLDAYDSLAVRRKVAMQDARQRRFAISTTPTMVVAGRYAVPAGIGRRRALDVVDHLISLERGGDLETGADSPR